MMDRLAEFNERHEIGVTFAICAAATLAAVVVLYLMWAVMY
jgi:hypothetical protein